MTTTFIRGMSQYVAVSLGVQLTVWRSGAKHILELRVYSMSSQFGRLEYTVWNDSVSGYWWKAQQSVVSLVHQFGVQSVSQLLVGWASYCVNLSSEVMCVYKLFLSWS